MNQMFINLALFKTFKCCFLLYLHIVLIYDSAITCNGQQFLNYKYDNLELKNEINLKFEISSIIHYNGYVRIQFHYFNLENSEKDLEVSKKIFEKAITGNVITRELCETGIKN